MNSNQIKSVQNKEANNNKRITIILGKMSWKMCKDPKCVDLANSMPKSVHCSPSDMSTCYF